MTDTDVRSQLLAAVAEETDGVDLDRAGVVAGRWTDATARMYLAEVRKARAWWEADRRAARQESPVRVPGPGTFMPWSPDLLARYVQHLAEGEVSPSSSGRARAAIRAWHHLHGLPVPDGMPASVVLSDYDRNRRAAGQGPRHAEPLPLAAALQVLATIDRGTNKGARDACFFLLAYGAILSGAVLRDLTVGAVATADGGLQVAGDPPRTVPHWTIAGEHHPAVCPVEATTGWAGRLLDRGAPRWSRLIRPVDMHDNIAGLGPWAGRLDQDGEPPRMDLAYSLAGLLASAGVEGPERYTLTSLRLGGLVRVWLGGVPVDELTAAAGLSTRTLTLLHTIRAAERLAPTMGGPDRTGDTP